MPYEFGDIVLIAFPFTDQVGQKQRPAVVVSSPDLGKLGADDRAALKEVVDKIVGS